MLAAAGITGYLGWAHPPASQTGGTAVVDTNAAPAYRSSVAASLSESAASATTVAVHNSCNTLVRTSTDAIEAINAYVGAFNTNGSDVAAKEGPAVDALHRSADLVTRSLSDALSPQLFDALTAYADSARGVADAISRHASPDEFNSAIEKLNNTKTNALNLCKGAY